MLAAILDRTGQFVRLRQLREQASKPNPLITQVYITTLPSGHVHSDAGLTFLLLAGCLSYANSAINPILYAFLSENFKKSFSKAFTCTGREALNAQLNQENSANPRTMRPNSSRGPNTQSKRDRNRLRDDFQGNIVSRGFSGFSIENHMSTLPTDLENGDFDEEEEEEDDEVVELEDSSNVMPMTSRISGGSVMGREQTQFNHDKEILLETSGFEEQKCLQPGPATDPSSL